MPREAWYRAVQVCSLLLTALVMAAGLAHLLALPNKIDLPAQAYLTVQQIYRGWNLLGIAFVAALVATAGLAVLSRHRPRTFSLVLAAALCLAASLTVFFLFTFPANRQTANWTILPDHWQALRQQWEYSHAAGAALDMAAFVLLVFSLLRDREP